MSSVSIYHSENRQNKYSPWEAHAPFGRLVATSSLLELLEPLPMSVSRSSELRLSTAAVCCHFFRRELNALYLSPNIAKGDDTHGCSIKLESHLVIFLIARTTARHDTIVEKEY